MNTPVIFNPEIRLTEHFKLGEFTKSITAEYLCIVNEKQRQPVILLTRIVLKGHEDYSHEAREVFSMCHSYRFH